MADSSTCLVDGSGRRIRCRSRGSCSPPTATRSIATSTSIARRRSCRRSSRRRPSPLRSAAASSSPACWPGARGGGTPGLARRARGVGAPRRGLLRRSSPPTRPSSTGRDRLRGAGRRARSAVFWLAVEALVRSGPGARGDLGRAGGARARRRPAARVVRLAAIRARRTHRCGHVGRDDRRQDVDGKRREASDAGPRTRRRRRASEPGGLDARHAHRVRERPTVAAARAALVAPACSASLPEACRAVPRRSDWRRSRRPRRRPSPRRSPTSSRGMRSGPRRRRTTAPGMASRASRSRPGHRCPSDIAAIFAETVSLMALHLYVNSAGVRFDAGPHTARSGAHRGPCRGRRDADGAAAELGLDHRRGLLADDLRSIAAPAPASSGTTSASIRSRSGSCACLRTSTCASAASAAGVRCPSGRTSTAIRSCREDACAPGRRQREVRRSLRFRRHRA